MKAAIYARTKSLKQIDKNEKITEHLSYLEAYCKQQNLKVVRRYYDIGKGKDYEAIGWKKLLEELESGSVKVKRLVCSSTDRHSQNIMEIMQLIQRINQRGIQIIFIDEQIISELEIGYRKK